MGQSIRLEVPIRIKSLNKAFGEHFMVRHRRIKKQQDMMLLVLLQNKTKLPRFPVSVKFIYHGKRRLDNDNATAACKGLRDEIAKFYGINDGDLRWQWLMPPEQITGRNIEYAVSIEITAI